MKLTNRKLMSFLAGAAIVAGVASPFAGTAYAAEQGHPGQPPAMSGQRPPQFNQGQRPPQFNKDLMAKEMADAFGLKESEIKDSLTRENHPRDIFMAALVAKTSNKSFAEVLKLKQEQNSWQSVEKTLGITAEALKATRDDVSASQMEKRAGIAKDKALALMKDGYRDGDIFMAGILAKETQKSIDEVLSMRKINNTWRDVAKELGVSADKFRPHFQGGMPWNAGEPKEGSAEESMMDGQE